MPSENGWLVCSRDGASYESLTIDPAINSYMTFGKSQHLSFIFFVHKWVDDTILNEWFSQDFNKNIKRQHVKELHKIENTE